MSKGRKKPITTIRMGDEKSMTKTSYKGVDIVTTSVELGPDTPRMGTYIMYHKIREVFPCDGDGVPVEKDSNPEYVCLVSYGYNNNHSVVTNKVARNMARNYGVPDVDGLVGNLIKVFYSPVHHYSARFLSSLLKKIHESDEFGINPADWEFLDETSLGEMVKKIKNHEFCPKLTDNGLYVLTGKRLVLDDHMLDTNTPSSLGLDGYIIGLMDVKGADLVFVEDEENSSVSREVLELDGEFWFCKDMVIDGYGIGWKLINIDELSGIKIPIEPYQSYLEDNFIGVAYKNRDDTRDNGESEAVAPEVSEGV